MYHNYFPLTNSMRKPKQKAVMLTITSFDKSEENPFEKNIVVKGENAGNQHFSPFTPMCCIL